MRLSEKRLFRPRCSAGTPEMRVGSLLTLERMGEPFNGGGYYVAWVRHTSDLAEGHRTRFVAERATVGEGNF
ncbi:MAG: hypothetical protein AB7E55_29940 [Pigmentiphaga sp.]